MVEVFTARQPGEAPELCQRAWTLQWHWEPHPAVASWAPFAQGEIYPSAENQHHSGPT